MSGILYVVATPIGNLEDVTLRALRVLRDVAVIAAEDTRRTGRLLQHYSISTPTTSLHEHNEHRKSAYLIGRLQAGESIALVSDAGTPLVSDPGARLVALTHEAGVRVEPVPGASAMMAALSVAGFDSALVHFAGFPPAKGTARAEWFARAGQLSGVLVLYEAPHRIRDTLADLLAKLGDQPMALARELTKTHEELVIRPISAHLEALGDPRGEYTLVVNLAVRRLETPDIPNDSALLSEFWSMTKTDAGNRRHLIKCLAGKYATTAKDIYDRLERAKLSVD
jgi:16S rRNA (cytidine1402-2'-O)-methyltransferase